MGTNFYLSDDTHIGKRSAAGPYCWDCRRTLCVQGTAAVHMSGRKWHDKCPICGKKREDESLDSSSGGRELGFNREPFEPKTGVKSCSSFTWAIDPAQFFIDKPEEIHDEYGHKFTFQEFTEMLKECPIRFYDAIGQEFC